MSRDKEKSSFGEVFMDVPPEFDGKICTCYLKQCISGIGSVRGIITGFRRIKDQDVIYFEAEDGHDFFVPLSNVAYYEFISQEVLEKSQEERESERLKAQQEDEGEIKEEIESRMRKVEEQLQNANKSENHGDPSTEEEGDSEFVFKL